MDNNLRKFLKYDRVLLALTVVFLILFAVFLYYLSNTHQPGCDYYYLHATKLLYPFVILVPTVLAIYTFAKLKLSRLTKPTNGQFFGIVLASAGIIVSAAFIYIVVGFSLFFGKTC
jgi:hypothetical protein